MSKNNGTIATKEIDGGYIDEKRKNDIIKIAVEYCESTGRTSGTIGTNKDMINTGAWETTPQPHLPKSKNEYKVLYRFGFQFKSFRFLCELLMDKDTKESCFFIYPKNSEFKEGTIVISDIVKVSSYWHRDIYNVDIKNKNLKNLLASFRESNIFYSSDLCGTDFKQVIDFSIKR